MSFLAHTKGILFKPESEWKAIRDEEDSFLSVFVKRAPLFALVPPVSAYYGVTQVGWQIGAGEVVKLSSSSALMLCAITYIAILIGIYALGESINWMSKTYGVEGSVEKRHYNGQALAVYVSIPLLLSGFSALYPSLWFVTCVMGLAATYSVYLIYQGVPILMDIPNERAFLFASSIITVGLVIMVTTIITAVIFWGMGIDPVYVD